MKTTNSGQRWARGGLAFGALFSILGNVTHTVMSQSSMTLWIRVPLAVVWPVALFIAVETLVRVDWRARFIDWLGRILLTLPVSIVAAVVSYLHLHHLMTLAGEPASASVLGPVAVDGLMIGSTVALLAIRAASLATEPEPEPELVSAPPALTSVLHEGRKSGVAETVDISQSWQPGKAYPETGGGKSELTAAEKQFSREDASAARAGYPATTRERASRTTPEEMRKAVLALLDDKSVKDALALAGLPDSKRAALGRYNTAKNRLRNNPAADVSDILGLSPELLALIRDDANRRRPL